MRKLSTEKLPSADWTVICILEIVLIGDGVGGPRVAPLLGMWF